jgi:hypothetical protein
VITRADQGWDTRSISRVLQGSRPPVDTWIARCAAEHGVGLLDNQRGRTAPPRNVWCPRMVPVYHLPQAHPAAGEFRLWSLWAQPAISVRTVGRLMALHTRGYDDLPPVPQHGCRLPPQPHPDKARSRQASWVSDGRQMDCALAGGTWRSLLSLEGYARPMLAGALAPTAATWAALMVLDTACGQDGAPTSLVSDSGGASPSEACEAVCGRLEIDHKTRVRTQGASDLNGIETHGHIQRRLYDEQWSRARTAGDGAQRHQAFIHTEKTTAPQGRLPAQRLPPLPVEVVGAAQGRRYSQEMLVEQCAHALLPRTTNRDGGVTVQRDHVSVEAGIPKSQGIRWVDGER